jgi:hypothetical protein
MHPIYTRAVRLRKDIIDILSRWHHGELSPAETCAAIDERAEEEFRAVEQDALRNARDDE